MHQDRYIGERSPIQYDVVQFFFLGGVRIPYTIPTWVPGLTVGVVRREESSERLMRRAPERPQQVVASSVVRAVVGVRRTGDVDRVRTLQRVRLRQHVALEHRERVPLQHLRHRVQQLPDLGVRQRKSEQHATAASTARENLLARGHILSIVLVRGHPIT